MLIGIDASRATVSTRTGVEGYSVNIIQSLVALDTPHRFRLYFRDEPGPDLLPHSDRIETCLIRRPRIWTHTGLGFEVRRSKPDVLFVPSHVLPWPGVGGVPAVVTVHDLGYRHYPDKHPLPDRLYLNWSTAHSTRLARRVIAVSHATAHDLIALGGVPREKVRVVHSGVDRSLGPVADEAAINRMRRNLSIQGPYILHVGSTRPRKNLPALISAFDRVKDTGSNLKLVLAGSKGWDYTRIKERIERLDLAERVILPGYVDDQYLIALYSDAEVYAFPSLYEGFGFPALEAMACEVPVVCSNASSLPELVGDAALTFAPTDIDTMAESLRRALTDNALRAQLIEKGRARVRQFTWDTCARETLAVIEETASGV
ncbi:MAG: glycosyltransferase family 4 protein [Anaerolineae bacterium]